MLAAEASLLLLLNSRANEAARKGGSLFSRAQSLSRGVESAVILGRDVARRSGVIDLSRTLGELTGASLPPVVDLADRVTDRLRAGRFADALAKDWFKRAQSGVLPDITPRLELAAATENAEAFNTGRAKALARTSVKLFRVWDAVLDRRRCPVCASADGMIVGANEPFPIGEPGAVHPRCRCTFSVLKATEINDSLRIEAA
jgi:SPP1 gp7 family putative phage head morphogenesis protein